MILKKCQKEAVDKLLITAKALLEKDDPRICVFKAPTGSGKTIMAADFLRQLSQENLTQEYAFIWISSNDLHTQSKGKLESYLSESRYTFSLLEDIGDKEFAANEIVFVNWHSLTKKDRTTGEWTNVFMRDNEQDRNLKAFVNNTKESGKQIILIVDESHYHYWSNQSQELVQDVIGPKLTLEVSATPSIEPPAEDVANEDAGFVSVKFDDVVADGLIKTEVIINKEIGSHVDIQVSADEAVLDAAIEKRDELEELYKQESLAINPLVLIQLPSQGQGTSALDVTKLELVEKHLKEQHGISVEDGSLAIWLSDKKENLEGITGNENHVKVLLFKQAIALGWDCPRAQILVMFRDIRSVTFETQTVGRIMRMPEATHYNNSELNRAFVYTNLERIDVGGDDTSKRFFQIYPSHRIAEFEDINLPSVYLSRIDYGDITLAFRKIFIEEANKRFSITSQDMGPNAYMKADKDLDLYPEELGQSVIADAVIPNVDLARHIMGATVDFAIPEDELKYKFEQFAKLASLPYAPVRSHTKIQQSIYDWFDNYLGYKDKSRLEIQRVIVCSEVNQKIFMEIIEESKRRFKNVRTEALKEKQRRKEYIWNVPKLDYFNETYEKVDANNYVMDVCYLLKDRSSQEKVFETTLNESEKIGWWYKNGTSKEAYFSISYTDDDIQRSFYPDYIVLKNDGTVGLYDTKSGMTINSPETAAKANALQDYIKNQNKKGNSLVGGIVTNTKEGLKVCTKAEYTRNVNAWDRFEL